MDLVHKGPLLFTNPNGRIFSSIFSSHVQVQDPRSPEGKPKKVPFKPLAESPNLGISDEEISPKGNLDIIPCNVENEGYHNANPSEEHTSHVLQGNKAIFYTFLNLKCCDVASSGQSSVVLDFLSEEVCESSFCDTLGVVRLHKDQNIVLSTQALVDPLDDKINSFHKNDLCPSSASTYNLNKVLLPSDKSIYTLVDPWEIHGESTLVCELPTTSKGMQNDQLGGVDLELLEYLGNLNCDCSCEHVFVCDPFSVHGDLYLCGDYSLKI